ncbi:HAD family acid phosphatase [Sphingomonas sp.]|uniref:HAD family acid phosphatase n=1 Tax=Sphingomonas sp. TaxID=28214 RepID=UPI0017EBD999|nr:HAD family acid phosphatase [Sphingomonas sp.]MBA4761704.1 acid phosphatase [Sphingomonas sp.]
MSRLRALLALGVAGLLCGGCVAAAIPIVAGGSIAGKRLLNGDKPAPEPVAAATPAPVAATPGDATATLATPEARALALRLQASAAASSPAAPVSAESAAASLQAYQSLWAYVERQVAARKAGEAVRSVVLAEGATLDAPRYVPCEAKPFAILFDLDESAAGGDPDARFRRWIGDGSDQVSAVPGAVEGIDALRREGVQAIFTSARRPSGNNAAAAMLAKLGFGEFVPGKTLILRGGEPPISGDQVRRTVAASYCVVAIVGDALGDFSDSFDAADAARSRAAATETMVAPLWGAGWFLLPNPVRSTATTTTELPKE